MNNTETPTTTEQQMIEVQRALDGLVDSIDVSKLGAVMERQMVAIVEGIECRKCGQMVKNLRGLSAHDRKHR